MESFRKFLASLGDIRPLMSANEAEPLFCAAESASRSYAVDEMSDAISRSMLAKNTQKHFFPIYWLKILKLRCVWLNDEKSASELH